MYNGDWKKIRRRHVPTKKEEREATLFTACIVLYMFIIGFVTMALVLLADPTIWESIWETIFQKLL